jgi:hypothetical protein
MFNIKYVTQTIEHEINDITSSDIWVLLTALPTIIEALVANAGAKPVIEVVAEAAPRVMPILERIANRFFPGAGTGLEVLVKVFYSPSTVTPDEEKTWFDRASQMS